MTSPLPGQKPLFWMLTLYGAATLVAMAPMNVGAGLSALLILGIWSARRPRESFPGWKIYFLLCCAFVVIAAISLWQAQSNPLVYSGRAVEVEFARDMSKFWYLFWPGLLALGLRWAGEARFLILRGWLGAFALLSGVGILQFFTGWPRPQPIPGFEPYFHATLGLGHHLSVASIWIFPFFLLLELLGGASPELREKILGRQRGLWWLALLAGAMTLFFTFSRMGWVAFGLGLLLWLFWRLTRSHRLKLGCAAMVVLAGLAQIPPIKNRLTSMIGVQERQDLWRANWEFFRQRPWTGIGFRQTEELSAYYLQEKKGVQDVFTGHAHNNALEVLSGTGIFGLLVWLGLQLWVLRLIWALPLFWRRAFLCAFLAFHCDGLTQVNFWEGKVQHQWAWILAWIFVLPRKEKGGHVLA